MKNLKKQNKLEKKRLGKKKGFTLIEMIIVIVIIGILAAAILPKILGAKERANDVKRIADLRNISIALEMYYQDNGEYPTGHNSLDKNLRMNEEFKKYMKDIPKDPLKNSGMGGSTLGEYYYHSLKKYGIPNNGYVLSAKMPSNKNANILASNEYRGYHDRTWERVKLGLESCPDGIKKGTHDSNCQAMPSDGKYRYVILSE